MALEEGCHKLMLKVGVSLCVSLKTLSYTQIIHKFIYYWLQKMFSTNLVFCSSKQLCSQEMSATPILSVDQRTSKACNINTTCMIKIVTNTVTVTLTVYIS